MAGEPGIGKTRLAAEATASGAAAGMRVHWGRCWDGGLTPAFWPWLQFVHGCLADAETDFARLERGDALPFDMLAPAWRQLLPGADPWPVSEAPSAAALPPGVARVRLFDAIARLLRWAAERTPLVLVLDDLHWADPDSLALLRFLACDAQPPNRLGDLPLAVLGTYRPEEVHRNPVLADLLADLAGTRHVEQVTLGALSAADVAEFAARLNGGPLAPAVAEAIAAQTEGNPFFIEELVRHLRAGGWNLAEETAAAACERVPDGLHQVIGRRLARLSPGALRLAQAAAVLGEDCSFDLVEATLAGTEDRSAAESPELDALDEALAAGVLVEHVGGVRFRHPLIRRSLYEGMSTPRRERLHRRAAAAIERLYARNLTPHLAALATHHRASGSSDPEAAISYALRAAEVAWDAFALAEAEAHWQTALALLEANGAEPLRRAGVLKWLGDVAAASGATTVAGVGYMERALALYEQAGAWEQAARLHITVGGHYCSAVADMDVERGAAHFRRARAMLERSTDPGARAHLEIGTAFAAVYGLRSAEGLAASGLALTLSEQGSSRRDQINARAINGWHLAASGRLAAGLAQLERAHVEAVAANDGLMSWRAAGWRGHWALFRGDPRDAAVWWRRELRGPRVAPESVTARVLTRNLAVAELALGDLATVRDLLPAAAEQPLTGWSVEPWLHWAEGSWTRAEELWSEVLTRARRSGDRWSQATVAMAMGDQMRAHGDRTAAEALLNEALDACAGGFAAGELRGRAVLALLHAEHGETQAARKQLARCQALLAAGEDWRGLAGHVALADAVVRAAGSRDGAAASFERALAIFRRYGLAWDEAEALLCRGRQLLNLRERGQAQACFSAARALYRRIGAGDAWLRRVEACRGAETAAAAPTAVPQADNIPAGRLSVREAEVLRLIAAGESNPAIAERLVLSVGTVARHTANIYAKIGARGRADAVAYALRQGLFDPSGS